ncbi:MAG: hypothetical protein II752_07015 [Muribaculaceae bacterium]|nr:hypothetical protein [Muribaculaceae bacterium]
MKTNVKILTMMLVMTLMAATSAFSLNAQNQKKPAAPATEQVAPVNAEPADSAAIAVDEPAVNDAEEESHDRQGGWLGESGAVLLVPLFGIIFSIGGPILLVIMFFYFSYRNKRNRFKVIEKAIEHGVANEQLEKLFEEQKSRKKSPIYSGLACFMTGVGCFLAYYMFMSEPILGIAGLITLMVGLGMIIAYSIEKKEKQNDDNGSEGAK